MILLYIVVGYFACAILSAVLAGFHDRFVEGHWGDLPIFWFGPVSLIIVFIICLIEIAETFPNLSQFFYKLGRGSK